MKNPLQLQTSDLDELFRTYKAPRFTELLNPDGTSAEWRVSMLTGAIPNMRGWPLHHRKQFTGNWVGHNVFRHNLRWGGFNLFYTIAADNDMPALLLNYDVPGNSFVARRIRDHVRMSNNDPNLMLGRFNIVWGSKLKFLGYFSLARIVT